MAKVEGDMVLPGYEKGAKQAGQGVTNQVIECPSTDIRFV